MHTKLLNLNYLRTFLMLAVMLLTTATAWAETVNVSYKDADGTTKYVDATVLNNTMNDLAAGWYVVNSDVTYNGDLETNGNGDVNIILCDGATLTASGIAPEGSSDRLKIYGQSQGTGTANISGTLEGCYSLTIYGGTINANRLDSGQGNVSIYGGSVNVETIAPYSGVFLYGGNVIVTDKIKADGSGGTISLCGATVKAGSYSADGYVCIEKGLTYYDGTGASYTGTEEHYTGLLNLTDAEITAIAGKTLRTFNYGSCGVQTVNDGKNVTWMMSDGDNNGSYETLIISGSGAMADFSGVDNQPWKASRADIEKVKIGADILNIGNNAFKDCSNLKTVLVLGENLPTLGTNAFDGCTSLSKIFISPSAYDENEYGAEPWKTYTDKIDQLFYCGKTSENDGKNVMCYFIDDDNDDKIETLTIIGTGAIMDCSSAAAIWDDFRSTIKNLFIEEGVTEIGNSAFKDCTSLTNVDIPASVTHIRPFAFKGCTSLTTAPIGSSVRYIGSKAFGGCTGLTSANIPAALEDGAKDDEGNVRYNGNFDLTTFEGCTSLTTITVAEDNPTFMAVDGVLMGKDGTDLVLYPQGRTATSNTVPNGVKRIIQQAFKDCSHLTNVTLSSSLKMIEKSAFENCTGLTLIMIPASVTNIETQAFRNCSSLKTVYVQRYDANGVSKITALDCTDVFEGCHKDLTIYVLIDAVDTYKADENWSSYADKIKGVKSCGDTQSNGGMNVLWEYDPETTTLRIYPNPDVAEGSNFDMANYLKKTTPWNDFKTDITTVIIENGVTDIGHSAFMDCTSLTTVDIPASVKKIDTYAFMNCGFTTFTFPNTVTYVGFDVLRQCSSLQSVTWSTGANNIQNFTFAECPALASFTIPDNVTSIGSSVFQGCTSLTSIDIPANVEYLGEYALAGCQNLKAVFVRRYDTTLNPSITTLGNRAFDGGPQDQAIYVPVAALDTYKKATNWASYKNNIKAIPVSVIIEQGGEEAPIVVDYMTLDEAIAYAGEMYDPQTPAVVPTLKLNGDIALGGSGVEFGNGTDALVATLDLNGHTITGTAYEYLITVAEKSTLTVTGDGAIGDINYWYGLIDNNGTLNITGGTYGNGSWMTNNGTMTVSGGTFTAYGGCASINNFGGSLTVSGGTFNVNGGGCAIQNWADLTLSALPTFVHSGNGTNFVDINLYKDAVITFDKAITTFPTAPITVKVKNAAPYVFTSGYGTYVKDTDDNVVDPASMFVVTADNSLLDNAVLGIHASEAALFATEKVTFPAGKTTYYSAKGLKLLGENDNLKFYTVTSVNNDAVELTEIKGKTFGKETPLIVSNESNADIDAVMREAFDDADNAAFAASCATDLGEKSVFSGFKGTAIGIDAIGMQNIVHYFGFTGHDFVLIRKDGPVAAHRCWLEVGGSSSSAARLNINWNEEVTEVKGVNASLEVKDDSWYTLDGRKLNGKPTAKGIYIYNGMKRVVK